MSKERVTRVSVSMPESMVKLAEKRLAQEYPRRTFSRLIQDLIADDLRESGMLPANGKRKDLAAA